MQIRFTTLFAAALVLGTTIATAQTPPPSAAPGKAPSYTVVLATKPAPPAAGQNDLTVTVTGPDGKPVVGADVSVTFLMPAMPAMKMAEIKHTVTLAPAGGKPADAGKYVGKGQIVIAGQWTVTISVTVDKKEVAAKTLVLTAK